MNVHRTLFLLCLSVLLSVCLEAEAYSLRQFTNKDGLTNSSILSLHQDHRGYMWIGTCDGLDFYDGTAIQTYPLSDIRMKQLSGSLISGILETEDGVLWVQTNYGLDRVELKRRQILHFTEFREGGFLFADAKGEVFLLGIDGNLHHYLRDARRFRLLQKVCSTEDEVLNAGIDNNGDLWIFFRNRVPLCFRVKGTGADVSLEQEHFFAHNHHLLWIGMEQETAYFVDDTHALYEYNFQNHESYYVADLSEVVSQYGEITALANWNDDYYIGFKTGGLVVLRRSRDYKVRFRIEKTPIRSGIFCLLKDRYQDILWVGTDGQGVYMYYDADYSVTATLTDASPYDIATPVRALYRDKNHTLWIGTKGNGILRIHDYNPVRPDASADFDRLTTANSFLSDDAVYCFSPGQGDRLWIGTENGINYYSFRHNRLGTLSVEAGGSPLRFVHAIEELNDTVLWVSTVGGGIVKVVLHPDEGGQPVVKRAERRLVGDGSMSANYFFTSFRENDSILWFGNRGYGACCVNTRTGHMDMRRFDDGINNTQLANDVFAIYKNRLGHWLGTSAGLLRLDNGLVAEPVRQMAYGTVHCIMEDRNGYLWVSTNRGLVRLNPHTFDLRLYGTELGLQVTEFSDGAFFNDHATQTLYFGGINGFVAIRPDGGSGSYYAPPVQLRSLSIFGRNSNLYDYLEQRDASLLLRLDYTDNFFQLNFCAVDYIDGNNYTYSYRMEGLSSQWVDNGTSSRISFSDLPPGLYKLHVKYRNNTSGKESEPAVFLIRIVPPWYLTVWAKVVFVLLILLSAGWLTVRLWQGYHRRQRQLVESMDRRKREEVYESKLRFFTSITQEFCTPLTLICGPCEKMLHCEHTDEQVRRYAGLIKQNAEKLNSLIQDLLEFRRLETGSKTLRVRRVPVSDRLREITASFRDMAEKRSIDYKADIEPGLTWGTDIGCFDKIVSSLLFNSFAYTPDGGTVSVSMSRKDAELCLQVSNSGPGISEDNLLKVSDRYKMLDSFGMKDSQGARTGLALYICNSMALLLKGRIEGRSTPGVQTVFTVCLPDLPADASPLLPQEAEEGGMDFSLAGTDVENGLAEQCGAKDGQQTDSRPVVLVMDSDPSMLWFVSDVFAEAYKVHAFSDPSLAFGSLEQSLPDLLVADAAMTCTDGQPVARKLKEDGRYAHIPLILLSSFNYDDGQAGETEACADAYVFKPFNVVHLQKLADRLIRRSAEMEEHHESMEISLSAKQPQELPADDREFLDRLLKTIEKNVANPDLSVEWLSAEMGYSSRQLYRKLKPVTDRSPADVIKDYRIVLAGRLLQKEQLTVDEAMARTGFSNRSTFYKLFTQRFGMTPRQYKEQGGGKTS